MHGGGGSAFLCKRNNDAYFWIQIFKTEICRMYKWLGLPSSSKQNAQSTNPCVTTQIHVSAKMFTEAHFLPLTLLSFSGQKNADAAHYFVLPCKLLVAELLVMRKGGGGVVWKWPDMHNTKRVIWLRASFLRPNWQASKPFILPILAGITNTLKHTLARFKLRLVEFNFRKLHIQPFLKTMVHKQNSWREVHIILSLLETVKQ